nr:hypothetical protein [uncultured Devosia sp.]
MLVPVHLLGNSEENRGAVVIAQPNQDGNWAGPADLRQEWTRRRASPLLDKALQHLLATGFFEFDAELVALDIDDGAVAEFEVEDAFAEAEGGAIIAQVDRAVSLNPSCWWAKLAR